MRRTLMHPEPRCGVAKPSQAQPNPRHSHRQNRRYRPPPSASPRLPRPRPTGTPPRRPAHHTEKQTCLAPNPQRTADSRRKPTQSLSHLIRELSASTRTGSWLRLLRRATPERTVFGSDLRESHYERFENAPGRAITRRRALPSRRTTCRRRSPTPGDHCMTSPVRWPLPVTAR